MTRKYNFWSFCQDAVAAAFAVPTCGASLVISPTARGVVKQVIGSGGGNDDNLNQNLKIWEIQNQQWNDLIKANQEEAKRLREERDEDNKKLKFNNEEITRLNAIINNPHSTEEEKNNARKQIAILEDENKQLKEKLDKIDEKIDALSKNPSAPKRPWTWPELKTLDKVILAGGVVLLIYLLIPENKKK